MQGFWVAPNKMSQQIQRQYRKTVDNALQGTWRYRTQNGLLWSKFTQRILSKSSHFSWALPAYHPHNLDPDFPPQSTTFQHFHRIKHLFWWKIDKQIWAGVNKHFMMKEQHFQHLHTTRFMHHKLQLGIWVKFLPDEKWQNHSLS